MRLSKNLKKVDGQGASLGRTLIRLSEFMNPDFEMTSYQISIDGTLFETYRKIISIPKRLKKKLRKKL